MERANETHEAASSDLSARLNSALLVSVITAATARARSEGAPTAGTGHLLDALISDGRVTAVLDTVGVRPDEVVRETVSSRCRTITPMPIGPGAGAHEGAEREGPILRQVLPVRRSRMTLHVER
ncbi:hypothetical protein ACSNOI_13320 [Actinomadura kijaniata]|uniref:hypothetical protein n=1 Tax=Actinomadura kijaniata TaxID=46161 RepID=UPI003F1DE19E